MPVSEIRAEVDQQLVGSFLFQLCILNHVKKFLLTRLAYEDAAMQVAAIEAKCAAREAKWHSIYIFQNSLLKSDEVVSEFSQTLWNVAVDHATVSNAGRITFTFRNQMEITSPEEGRVAEAYAIAKLMYEFVH